MKTEGGKSKHKRQHHPNEVHGDEDDTAAADEKPGWFGLEMMNITAYETTLQTFAVLQRRKLLSCRFRGQPRVGKLTERRSTHTVEFFPASHHNTPIHNRRRNWNLSKTQTMFAFAEELLSCLFLAVQFQV
ncbi:nitrile hydratase [Anopheles sinensis]|uniref:Nitrile hydratase n=1 Tax=Anopheles sinensis TaxID=74873 RepID=A0A084WJ94_ANOSI|nr:nitrile hydratase [Anopheles sinensis]